MMQDAYSGLFGPTAQQIQQAQQQQLQQRGDQLAQMDPYARAGSMLYSGAGGLMGMAAEKMGGVNPQVQQAEKMRTLMSDQSIDTGTSEGLMALAQKLQAAGMTDKAFMVVQKANELKRQEAAGMIAARKQDAMEKRDEFNQTQQFELQRETRMGQLDIQRQTLEQRAVEAKQRSEDMRLSIEQRAEAARLAAEARRDANMTRQLIAQTARGKPLTGPQQAKLDKDKSQSSSAIRAQDSEIVSLGSDIDKAIADPNLSKATGMSSLIWSRPGGEASKVEGQLESIANRLKAQGLKVLREGGGIGAITEKEWEILANQVANIDRKKGDDYVKGELEKVKLRMLEMKRNAAQRHAEQFGEEYSPSRDAAPGMPSPSEIAAEIARRKGGK